MCLLIVFSHSVYGVKLATVRGREWTECVAVLSDFPDIGILRPHLHNFNGSIFQSLLFNYLLNVPPKPLQLLPLNVPENRNSPITCVCMCVCVCSRK